MTVFYKATQQLLFIALFVSMQQVYARQTWSNRIGNQICTLTEYHEPKSLEELSDTIKEAVIKNQTIRAMGEGYSISDVGCTNGRLINLKHLNRVLSVEIKKKLIRVEAGISISALNEQLAVFGLALPNQPAIAQISLGGALSTGVHGTGHTGTFSSFLKEIELITADGVLHRLSRDSDYDAFASAALSLGSLGVIYAATLECEPLFYLNLIQENSTLSYVLENYKTLQEKNEFFSFFWNTDHHTVVINKWNRCENDHSIDCFPSYKALPWYSLDVNNKDLFSEIAIPINSLPLAVDKIAQLIQTYKALGAKIADLHVRFVEKDCDALLSPASNGPAAYIAFSILDQDKYLALYEDFENHMMKLNARPHWGKINFLNHEKALDLYDINLNRFIQVKRKFDPHHVFSNEFTKRVLGS